MALREVFIEAIGDDFAQVSGQWLQGERVAGHLVEARRVWAFSAENDAALELLLSRIPCATGERLIVLLPGAQPGWEAAERDAVRALLEDAPGGGQAGLILALPIPECRCPYKRMGITPDAHACMKCGATNAAAKALYECNET